LGRSRGRFLFLFRGRVSPRRATYFLLLRQKNVSKEKATLLSATLRFAAGNLRCSRFAGSRRTRFAQTAASPDPRNLRSALLGAAKKFGPALRSRSALKYHTQPMQGRHARVSALRAERSDGPCCLHPLWLRRGAQRFADQGSPLSERSEFGETPRNVSTAGCPVAQRRGRRQWGRLSFAYLSLAKQRKVGRPPGRDPASGNKPYSAVFKTERSTRPRRAYR
jgi:hypothetical protein